MKLVCGQDVVDVCVALFPRASHRARRILHAYRATRARGRGLEVDRPTPVREPRVRVDRTLLALTEFPTPAAHQRARAVTIDGLEHLDAALARATGVILWLSPIGDRTLGIFALLQRGYTLIQLHGHGHGGSRSWFGQRVMRRVHRRIEARVVEEIITIDEHGIAYLRKVVDRLKRNKIVCIPPLGGDGNKFVALPFQGTTRYFPTGALTLARQTGAALIASFGVVDDDGRARLTLTPPFPVRDVEKGDRGLVRLARLYVDELSAYADRYPKAWWGWPDAPARLDALTILHDAGAEPATP